MNNFIFLDGLQIAKLASGLRAVGVEPTQKVGTLGSNSPELLMGMEACSRMNMVCVPLYGKGGIFAQGG
jgi:long-chain acyl-CoA synthetase